MFTIRALGRSILAVAVLAVAIATTSPSHAAEAAFHTRLLKSNPAANDTIAMAPHTFRFWFSEKVELPVTRVKLADAAGTPIALTPVVRADSVANAPLETTVGTSLPAGRYVVSWSTASKDGHAVKGTFAFVVKAAR